ncbi:MAG: hypothetical protein E7576_14095 [Ruminococcaceae bacterium]|nr:hypothetical protein [Oscillospiraceae bacterium]
MTLIIGRRLTGSSSYRVTEGWAGRLAYIAQYEEEGTVFHVRDGGGVYLATLERAHVNEHRLAGFNVYKDTRLAGEMLAFPDRTWSKDWLDPTLYVLYRHWHVSHGWITGENRVTAATVAQSPIGKKLTVHDPADALDALLSVLALFLYRDWFGKEHF